MRVGSDFDHPPKANHHEVEPGPSIHGQLDTGHHLRIMQKPIVSHKQQSKSMVLQITEIREFVQSHVQPHPYLKLCTSEFAQIHMK